MHSYDGGVGSGSVGIGGVSGLSYSLTGSLPTQVLKVYADATQGVSEYARWVGDKRYALSDHLANVKVVISDEKLVSDVNNSGTVDNGDSFEPRVLSYIGGYYPFGMKKPDLQFYGGDKPRLDYNGKETDQESGLQDYGMRMNDVRIAKFLSVDPLASVYPDLTPYQYASNTPIAAKDIDGAEADAKFDGMERNTRKAAKILYPGDFEKQEEYIFNASKDRATGAALGAGVVLAVATAPYISSFIIRAAVWASANPEMTMQGTALIGGLFYDGPEDLYQGSNADELGKAFRGTGVKILNYFSGPANKYKSALNISPDATKGFKGTIAEFTKYLTDKKLLGTVDNIIADNPYGYMDYLVDAAAALKKGGVMIVRGTTSNKYFKQVLEGKAKGLEEFKVLRTATKVTDEVKNTMKTTDGEPIKGDVFEIFLMRK